VGICNILSIDGGGVRGTIPAELIKRLNEIEPCILRKADVFTGNSAGSFTATALAYGYTPEEILNFYTENTWMYIEEENPSPNGPTYLRDHIKEVFTSYFGNAKLSDLKKKVVIPSFYVGENGKCWRHMIYNNFNCSKNKNARIVDALLSSCALPGMFPSYGRNVDGTVIDNDPSILALIEVLNSTCGLSLNDINILAFGTGVYCKYIEGDTTKFSTHDWFGEADGNPYFDMTLYAGRRQTEKLLRAIFGENYLKLDPDLTEDDDLTNPFAIPQLYEDADVFDISNALHFLREKWCNKKRCYK
jgi:hypothetical protein